VRAAYIRPIKWLCSWGAAIVIVVFLIGSAESFQQCIQDRKHQQFYQVLQEEAGLFMKSVARLKLNTACARRTIGQNDGAVAAISTIFVAFFTFTLWRETNRLWASTERSAKAAELAANVADASLRFDQRARVSIESASVDRNVIHGHLCVMWSLHNIGREPAIGRNPALFVGSGDKLIIPSSDKVYIGSNLAELSDVIAPGETVECSRFHPDFPAEAYAAARENKLFLHVAISLTYRDGRNVEHVAWKWFKFETNPTLAMEPPPEGFRIYSGRQD
jgi:hypothetical protein